MDQVREVLFRAARVTGIFVVGVFVGMGVLVYGGEQIGTGFVRVGVRALQAGSPSSFDVSVQTVSTVADNSALREAVVAETTRQLVAMVAAPVSRGGHR